MIDFYIDKKVDLNATCPIYSNQMSILMAQCSQIAYEYENKNKLKALLSELNFEYIDSKTTEPQLFMAKQRNFYVIAFAGTKGLSDHISNINFFQKIKRDKVQIHQSYKKYYRLTHQYLTLLIDQELQIDKKPVYITGHSRGGALAIIATSQLTSQM